jgi:RNA polymerase sigma-70 factor (ECF subfamily)
MLAPGNPYKHVQVWSLPMHASMGAVETAPPLSTVGVEPRSFPLRSREEDPDGDAALVVRLATGDTSALDVLYQRHYEQAIAVALALLRDRSAAEDLVHEAFLRAWQHAGSFHARRGSFRSWLQTIVRNAAIDQLRQQAMQRKPNNLAAQESLRASPELDIPAQVILSLDAERLHRALSELAPEQRSAIRQAFFGELTHREIAEREGLPLGTVKGRVRLGLQRMRTSLDNPERPR